MIVYEWDSLSFQVSCADWIIGTGLYQVIGISALSLTVLSETFDVIFLDPPFGHGWLERVVPLIHPLCGDDTLLYIETEKSVDLSALTSAGWHCVREGKTQQTQYGLWHLA